MGILVLKLLSLGLILNSFLDPERKVVGTNEAGIVGREGTVSSNSRGVWKAMWEPRDKVSVNPPPTPHSHRMNQKERELGSWYSSRGLPGSKACILPLHGLHPESGAHACSAYACCCDHHQVTLNLSIEIPHLTSGNNSPWASLQSL